MPTAKELNLQKGDVVEMMGFGLPKRYSEASIGFCMENVKVEIVGVDGNYKNVIVKYLEESKIAGAHADDVRTVTNPKYCGFYRLENQSNV